MHFIIYKRFWKLLDLIFPPSCAGCNQPGTHWCFECNTNTERIQPPICDICGSSFRLGNRCFRCINNPPEISAIRSWGLFSGPLRDAIHRLKYNHNLGLGFVFSSYLSEILTRTKWKINYVTPVPLGIARLKERGYNQASLLARPVAFYQNLPYVPQILKRTRETRSQVDLSRSERKLNVEGAFWAYKKIVYGQSVLIIDDVTTSGSTLDSCANALFTAGANKVYGLTLARAR